MLQRCAVVAFVAISAVASAQQVQLEVTSQVRGGQRPAVMVTSPVPVAHVHADLERDGKSVRLDHGAARAGERVRMPLPSPGHYEGKVVTTFTDGNRRTDELKFDIVTSAGVMHIGYAKEHLDLDAHTLEFTLSKPAAHAELKVLGEDGAELATATADYKGERPGNWLPIHWTPSRAGKVAALELRATSSDGATTNLRLVPYSVNVPHVEVVFETGKADIRPTEEGKLDASYQKIVDAVAVARKIEPDRPVTLFIAGHTDTVGTSADNRKLSLARAKAIGAWFRDRGLPLPIAIAGFGEDALKVKTPDETDNAANRRADYIVAFEEPLVARGVRATWLKLQ
jgi:outer membrane protein OmpA-like peptidoglycan-associated protein